MHLRIAAVLGLTVAMCSAPAVAAPSGGAGAPDALRVMTFNVRYPSPDDGINVWSNRRDLMVKVIREQHPDILGTQELFLRQGKYLASHLKHYKWFGLGRNGNNQEANDNEHMGVFYDTERLRTIERGNFWLSETPNIPGSISWNQPMPRMVTWAEFQDKATGKRFYYFNTHLPYRTKDEDLRQRDAKIILKRIAKVPASLPVIVTGDFNSTPDKPTHAIMTSVLKDARLSAPVKHGPARTFHDFTGKPTQRIDYIFYRGLTARSVRTVTMHDGKVYPSDHFPVVADFAWQKTN
jgi:endonuclease/exonuclease/phosphatase family metal-dependent hydrolase